MAIYYLDVDDEITSAAARIRDSSDSRIALVLSSGSRVATSRINFRLLAREAKHRGKRLAIIAADPSVQSVARSAELRVYASVGDYERAEAAMLRGAGRQPGQVSETLNEPASTAKPAVAPAVTRVAGAPGGAAWIAWVRVSRPLLVGIGALLILVLAAAAFFFYPSASVVLTLRGDPVGPITLSVKVDPAVTAANDQAAIVPGLSKAFPVDASGTFDATGQKVVDTAASGTVTFTSYNTGGSVRVASGTKVTTADRTAFVTTAAVVVPAATVSVPSFRVTPGTADAPIAAVNKGLSGNVPANSIVGAPAALVSDLVNSINPVTNKAPTTGGTHVVTPEIQQSDVDAATASLMSQLEASFQDAMTAPGAVPSGSTLFEATAKLGPAVCNPDPQTLAGQGLASFQLDCQASGSVTMADMATVRELATRRIRASVRSGYSILSGSAAATVGTPLLEGADVVVPVVVDAVQVPNVDVDKLRAGIKGKPLNEARAFLDQYGKADVSVSPSWASTMPSFDFRIDVRLVVPAASPAPLPSASANPSGGGGVTTPHVTKAPTTPTGTESASASPGASPSSGASSSPSPSLGPSPLPSPSPSPSASPAPTEAPSSSANPS